MWQIRDKTVLITGGTSGIGKATAMALARQGARVVLTSRDEERGKAAARDIAQTAGTEVEHRALNLASLASIRAFCTSFVREHGRLHVLINNAGVTLGKRKVTEDGFEELFAVNYLGPFVLTTSLLDLIVASAPARIINVSSRIHRLAPQGLDYDDLQLEKSYSGRAAYARSKLALQLFTRNLAQRLQDTQVTVNALHPGAVISHFRDEAGAPVRFLFFLMRPTLLTAEQGAETTVHLATSPELDGVTGKYFSKSAIVEPSGAAQDDEAARHLWSVTEKLLAETSAFARK